MHATRTNLIGPLTFSRDISIRICILGGKSVGFSLSLRSAERHEKCAASFQSLVLSLSFALFFPLSLLSLPLSPSPIYTLSRPFFFPQNKPEAPLPSTGTTNTRRYIYFFYCLAPEFPIVSRNLSLHGKFGHAEAGAFILRRR